MNIDEFTEKVFEKLNRTVNATGGLHPLDEDRIKGLYKALYADRRDLNIELLDKLAKDNSWTKTANDFLIKKANHVAEGGRVQLKHDKDSGERVYKSIIE